MFCKDREFILLVTYCLHLLTCDNKVQYRFLNADISAYDFLYKKWYCRGNDVIDLFNVISF